MKKNIVVVGAGKGLGNAVAKRFGKSGFRVILIARNVGNLNAYKEEFEKEGIETFIYSADCEKPQTLESAFKEIQDAFGVVDVLVYNARVRKDGFATAFSNDDFIKHYQTDVASALCCVKLVMQKQAQQRSGAILLSGGIFGDNPSKEHAGISIGKAALKALGKTLHDELKEKGIFVGLITIAGHIQPNTQHAPELIAEKYWKTYQKQDKYEVVY